MKDIKENKMNKEKETWQDRFVTEYKQLNNLIIGNESYSGKKNLCP